jgi:hypothetical protein
MADSDVTISFGAAIGQLIDGVGEVNEHLESLQDTAESVTEAFQGLAELAGLSLGVEGIKEWIAATTEAAERIETLSHQLGASAEQVQLLGGMAKLAGADFDSLVSDLSRMETQLAKTGETSNRAAQALSAIGINVEAFRRLTPVDQVMKFAEALSRYADGANKIVIANAVLGRSGSEMISFLDQGQEGMEKLRDAVEQTGVVMGDQAVRQYAQTGQDLKILGQAAQGFSQRLYSDVDPAVDATSKQLAKLLEAANPTEFDVALEKFSADLGKMVVDIAKFCKDALGPLAEIYEMADKLGHVLDHIHESGQRGDGTVFSNDAFKGNYAPPGSGYGSAPFGYLNNPDLQGIGAIPPTPGAGSSSGAAAASGGAAVARLGMSAEETANELDRMKARVQAQAQQGTSSGKPPAPQMNFGGGAAAGKDAMDAFNQDVILAQAAAKKIEEQQNELLKTHQITMQQWLTQTQAAMSGEEAAIDDASDKATSNAALNSEQRKAIWNRELKYIEEIQQQIQKAQDKAAEESVQVWTSTTNTINGAFNSQVNGLLEGTTNWHTAMVNVLRDLTAKTIEYFLDWALKIIENEALQLAANNTVTGSIVAGFGLQAAAQQSAAAAGGVAALASAGKALAADASQVFGGIFAFLAPVMGPAAAAPAAAGAAVVSAGGIGHNAMGSWELDRDMLSVLHAGEMIIPASFASGLRAAIGGAGSGRASGGHTFHTNVSANFHSAHMSAGDMVDRLASMPRAAAKRFLRQMGLK